MHRRGTLLGNAWLVTGASGLAVAVLCLLLWNLGHRPGIGGKTLKIFCAAGLRPPVSQIVDEYEKEFKITIQADFKGTGELFSSFAKLGMPGDLFISADSTTMRDAIKAGWIEETIPVAVIRPVLIVNTKTQEKLKKQGKPVQGLEDLLRPDLKVVLAAHSTAIGRVSKTILAEHGLWTSIEKRKAESSALVTDVATVNAVAETVGLRDNYIGVVWDFVAKLYSGVTVVPVKSLEKVKEHVEIGVLKKSAHPARALHFARYLTARDKGLTTFAKYRFAVIPDGDFWADRPQLRVAAGAMLQKGLEDILPAFEKREGIAKIDTDFQGCGMLVSKMEALARTSFKNFPDVFVSCDILFTRKVQQYFENAVPLLENDFILVVPHDNPKNINALSDLKKPENLGKLKIGLPHPQNSAMGFMIRELLQELDFPEETFDPDKNDKIVTSDAAHTLISQIGALDVAIVGRSNALSSPDNLGKRLLVKELNLTQAERRKLRDARTRALQTFSISRETKHRYLAERLLKTITSPANLERFRKAGFNVEPSQR